MTVLIDLSDMAAPRSCVNECPDATLMKRIGSRGEPIRVDVASAATVGLTFRATLGMRVAARRTQNTVEYRLDHWAD